MNNKIIRFPKITTILIFLISLSLSFIAHYYNMFNYPYFENDEGTYFSQAYSVAYQGKLADYTYWYDHAPLGWILTAGWMLLTGGPFAFGCSLYSARIFMLVIHCLETIIIFLLVKKFTDKNWPSFLAIVFFSLSPLAVYFQRRLLLDNIMTFWLLLSVYLLIISRQRLFYILSSGFIFGIALLTKETAIVTLPVFILLSYEVMHRQQKIIGTALFISPVILMGFYYFLYAILNGEFFPGVNHVSLIESLKFQITRGEGVPFWNPHSMFLANLRDWFIKDKIFVISLFIANIWIVVNFKKAKKIRIFGLIGLSFWLSFLFKSFILNFYLLPLILLGAIFLSVLLNDLAKIKHIGFLLVLIFLTFWAGSLNLKTWTIDENSPQVASIEWIKKNIPPKAVVAIDHAQLLNLQLSRFPSDPAFTNAHWFQKISNDPQIKTNILKNDWRNLDYLVVSHEYLKQLKQSKNEFLEPTIEHALEIASWGPNSPETYLDIRTNISTNGDWIKIYKMLDRNEIILLDSWNFYKENFITFEGQVIDPQTGITTSEGQSYALLRSVIMKDSQAFSSIWNWTKSHLQKRNEDQLFSWKWGKSGNQEKVLDFESASDADIDIATALIFASKTWPEQKYKDEAKIIISDIWEKEVIKLGDDKYYLTGGTWAAYGGLVYINPSYFSPAAFSLFQQIDPVHDWNQVKLDSYLHLSRLSKLEKTGLIPDWIAVDKESLGLVKPEIKNLSSDFGYDAVRIYYRVAEDYFWNKNEEAFNFLNDQEFLNNFWKQNKNIPAGISLKGNPLVDYQDNSFYGVLLPYFKIVDKNSYEDLTKKLQKDYKNGNWIDKNNYYTQNWVWLGFALANGQYL